MPPPISMDAVVNEPKAHLISIAIVNLLEISARTLDFPSS